MDFPSPPVSSSLWRESPAQVGRGSKRGDVSKSEVNAELGLRLRRVRLAAGYTLEWTAGQAGLTKGYLSKVERGLATPSIAAVNRLSEIYGVTVAEFFMSEGARKPFAVLRAGERREVNRVGSEIGYRYEVGDFAKLNPRAEVFFLTLPPVPRTGALPHFRHSGEEILLVLEGEIAFNYAGVGIMLYAGDCIQFEAHIDHFGTAAGEREARAFVVIVPDQPAR